MAFTSFNQIQIGMRVRSIYSGSYHNRFGKIGTIQGLDIFEPTLYNDRNRIFIQWDDGNNDHPFYRNYASLEPYVPFDDMS